VRSAVRGGAPAELDGKVLYRRAVGSYSISISMLMDTCIIS
jgi:hypothetical protein